MRFPKHTCITRMNSKMFVAFCGVLVVMFLKVSAEQGGTILLRLNSLENKNDASGCCVACTGSCNYQLEIWVTCDNRKNKSTCLYGYSKTGIFPSSSKITFPESLGNGLHNPLVYKFSSFHGTLGFQIQVTNQSEVKVDDYVYHVAHYPERNSTRKWTSMIDKAEGGSESMLNLTYTVSCNQHYYVPSCIIGCVPDKNYRCDKNSGIKLCNAGWLGPKCNCTMGNHNTCDVSTGKKICYRSWFGENCDVKCEPKNDSLSGFSCHKTTGRKICLRGWYGNDCNLRTPMIQGVSNSSISTIHSRQSETFASKPKHTSGHQSSKKPHVTYIRNHASKITKRHPQSCLSLSCNLTSSVATSLQLSSVQSTSLQPSSLQPSSLQPSSLQSTSVQLTSLQPSSLQPTSVQPTSLQPTSLQPSSVQSSSVQPSSLQPSSVQPTSLQPSSLQPTSLQPSSLQPSSLQPTSLQPSSLQPSSVQPSSVQSTSLQPSSLQPSSVQSSSVQPSSLQPSSVQPSSVQPTSLQPSSLQPSSLQLSLVQPTSLQPSSLQPSSVQLTLVNTRIRISNISISQGPVGTSVDIKEHTGRPEVLSPTKNPIIIEPHPTLGETSNEGTMDASVDNEGHTGTLEVLSQTIGPGIIEPNPSVPKSSSVGETRDIEPGSKEARKKHNVWWMVVLPFVLPVVALLIVAGVVILKKSGRNRRKVSSKEHYAIELEERNHEERKTVQGGTEDDKNNLQATHVCMDRERQRAFISDGLPNVQTS